jgi:hypothetical protein
MFNLENISVRELFQIEDEELFKKYLRFTDENDGFYIKPRGIFAKRKASPLVELTCGEVANIKLNLANPTFDNVYDCFEMVFKVKLNTYLSQDVVSYFYALNWIKENIKKLVEREKNAFGADPDPLLEMAGVKRLAAFGELNTLISIAQKYGKSPAEVENWKYNLVFALMLQDKVAGEVQHAYNELKYGSKGKA